MLPIEVWHKLSSKKLSGLCFGLHKKENLFTPEIWDFHDDRIIAKTARKVSFSIYEIYKILHDQLFSNKTFRLGIIELSVKSVLFWDKSVEFFFQKCRKYPDIVFDAGHSSGIDYSNHLFAKAIDVIRLKLNDFIKSPLFQRIWITVLPINNGENAILTRGTSIGKVGKAMKRQALSNGITSCNKFDLNDRYTFSLNKGRFVLDLFGVLRNCGP